VENCISLAEASRRCGRPARALSDAIYSGRIDASGWPRVSGRLVVPLSAMAEVRRVLRGEAAGDKQPERASR
jgi:hypothetical protein